MPGGKSMIPKKIHYCWFGRSEKPKLVRKCIASWKKYCPDYEIVEWNEDNYDISSAPLFVKQALEEKKYAFATDYIRYQTVYEHGGFYFDTDVELLKDPDFLRSEKAFFGAQFDHLIASGLGFGAEKGTPILRDLMKTYEEIPFILPDGKTDTQACPKRDTPVFIRFGYRNDGQEQIIEGGVHIYPEEFFCPKGFYDTKVRKTENTVAIHWFHSSWASKRFRWRTRLGKVFGIERVDRVWNKIKRKR